MKLNSSFQASLSLPPLTTRQPGYQVLVGQSSEMRRIIQLIPRIAAANISVLIRGESGTGKELIAKAIHLHSARANQPFVALNAASIPEGLVESELFGHERGAYTGAVTRYGGKVEQANGGTLFLDEIGDMPTPSQAKLLRVIQERRFQRLGGTDIVESDFRLLTATHKNLDELIRGGTFREDLYFRLAVFEIYVPSLRERREDIPLLANQFLSEFRTESNTSSLYISHHALDMLLDYEWPGNVRELQNVIQHSLLLCEGGEIQPEHLPQRIRCKSRLSSSQLPKNLQPIGCCQSSAERMEDIERKALIEAIDRCNGNLSMAIRELKIGRGRLYRKLKRYDLMERVRIKRKTT